MPRARIAYARFLASADSTLLPPPFLAPRVFAAAPFAPARTAGNGTTRTDIGRKYELGNNGIKRGNFGGSTAEGLKNVRYRDIASFVRQQIRSYATKPRAIPVVRRVASTPKERRLGRVRLTPGRLPTAPRLIRKPIRRVPAPPKTRKHSGVIGQPLHRQVLTSPPRDPLLDRRRKRALAVNRKRLKLMLAYDPWATATTAMQIGRYRSLKRRILNASRQGPEILDMKRVEQGLQRHRLLLRAFAGVARKLYPGAGRSSYPLQIRHYPRCIEWCAQLFTGTDVREEERVWNRWNELVREGKDSFWDVILLYLVDCQPERALQFLRIIARDTSLETSPAIIADALELLARRYTKGEMEGMLNRASFVPTFCHLFQQRLSKHKAICTQDLLLNIARLAHVKDLKLVYDLISNDVFWGYDTLLHWASKFGTHGDHDYAILCLNKVIQSAKSEVGKQEIVSRQRFNWSCALILRKSVENGQNYDKTADIVAQFLQLGVKLDIVLYNVVMHNAMEAGDYKVAFRVYNLLEENGVQPDKRTYSILLHGCTVAENPKMFRDFAEHCKRMVFELQDPWLASDCLYYEYICHPTWQEADIEHVYPFMHRTYSQYFSHEPLEWLSSNYDRHLPRPPLSSHPDDENSTLDFLKEPPPPLEPPPVVLYIMLQLEIRRAVAISTARVWDLFKSFRHQVRPCDPDKAPTHDHTHSNLRELASKPIIWNAFLLAFCRGQQFANASHLIKTMPVVPNIYSWNIFMQGFFKTSQIQAAERVWEIMQARDVAPDQFTYSVLLRGYARAQYAEKIGVVMDELDGEKQLHPSILGALARMRDRESLMRELDMSRQRKERKEKQRLKKEEEEKIKRWELPTFTPLAPRPRGELVDELGSKQARARGFRLLMTR